MHTVHHPWRAFALLALALLLMCSPVVVHASEAGSSKTLTLAVVPQYPPLIVHRIWQPFLDAVNQNSGLKITLKAYDSFTRFEADMLAGKADLFYFNPHHLVRSRQVQGYIPLLRDGENRLTGIIVVRKDSPINKVTELEGESVAFPAPNALAASLYMRTLLGEVYKLNISPQYVHSHSNVYRSVWQRRTVAGGGVFRTLNKQPEAIRQELRIIFETPPLAPHPIAIHPRIDKNVRERVLTTVLEMAKKPQYRHLFESIQIPTPVMADYERDYRVLEGLGLDKYLGNS